MQYNTVVSGAMKMLNALEDWVPRRRRRPVALIRGLCILLRAVPGHAAHRPRAVEGQLGLRQRRSATCSTPWPQGSGSAQTGADEIELMLRSHGKLRGAIRVPAAAGKAEIERLAVASEAFEIRRRRAVKKVVVGAQAPWSTWWSEWLAAAPCFAPLAAGAAAGRAAADRLRGSRCANPPVFAR